MTEKKWLTLEEMFDAPVPVSWLNEPFVCPEVVVSETAAQRARRRWHMNEDEVAR